MAGSLAACLPAEGPPDAGSPQSPAEPRGGNPGAFGRPRCSLCAWSLEQKTGGWKELLLFSNPHNRFNRTFLKCRSAAAAATCNFGERFSPLNG